MKRLVPILTALVLSGCATDVAYSPLPAPSGSPAAEVYVIRDRSYAANLLGSAPTTEQWVVSLDGRDLVPLRMGEYSRFTAEPGETHTIGFKRWDFWWHAEETSAVFEPGGTYYFLAGSDEPFGMYVRPISREQAASWLKGNAFVTLGR